HPRYPVQTLREHVDKSERDRCELKALYHNVSVSCIRASAVRNWPISVICQLSCGTMLPADKAHFAISSLRMNTTPFCFWAYLIKSSISLTRPGIPDIRSCVLIDIIRRREAASA